MFFCEYYKIFINLFFCRTRSVVASATTSKYFCVILLKRGKTIELPLHKKWSFPLRISSVNVNKSAVSCFSVNLEFGMNGIKIIWRKSSRSEAFGRFSRKHLPWNLFSVKFLLQKTAGVFLWILKKFLKPLFYKTPAYGFFCWYFS